MNYKLIGLAAAGTLALAACSSSTDSTSTSPSPTSPAPTSASAMPSESMSNIVGVASANASTSTLVTALDAAGLVSTLEGPGPFTVFAPTNDAFAALPAGVLDKLVQPQNKDALTKVLTYHVVSGDVKAADVKDGPVDTVEGQSITLSTANGGVTVNDATVTTADVEASNGVIHLINKVLLPPDVDLNSLQ